MSDSTASPLDIRAILTRIDRDLAESAKLREEATKLAAEQHKLAAEADKLASEARKIGAETNRVADERLKLAAEAAKLQRDRGLAPWLAIVTILTGISGLVGGAITVLHIFGKV